MRSRLPAAMAACGLIVAVIGCNAPKVQRQTEIERFKAELAARQAALKVDFSRPLLLAECEQIALANSLDLQVKRLSLQVQDDRVRISIMSGLPKAAAQYDYTTRNNEPLMKGGPGIQFEDQNMRRFSVSGVAPALDFGLTYYAWQIAKDRREQERLLVQRSEQLLRRDVRIAYAQHAGAIRQQRLSELAMKAAKEVMRVALSLEREKMTVPADTSLVRAAMAQAELDLSLATSRVQETRMVLGQLLSLPPGRLFAIADALPTVADPPTPEQVAAYEDCALRDRPELAVQDFQRHISANTVRKEIAGFFPRVDLIGAYNRSSFSLLADPAYFMAGYSISHSLLDGGSRIWVFNIAKTNVGVEEQRTLLLSLGIIYEVNMRALRLRQAADVLHAQRIVESARKDELDRIVKLYNEGLKDVAETAKSLVDWAVQSSNLDKAQTDYLVAWHELETTAMTSAAPTTRPAAQSTQPATQPESPKAGTP